MLKDAASSAKPTKNAQNNRHGMYLGTMGARFSAEGAEYRQWDGETQIAQGYDLVQAAGPCDISLRSPQRNHENQDAGAAHRNHRGRGPKKRGLSGCVHVGAKRWSRALPGTSFPGRRGFKLYNEEWARTLPRALTGACLVLFLPEKAAHLPNRLAGCPQVFDLTTGQRFHIRHECRT